MMRRITPPVYSATSPASASTAVLFTVTGLSKFDMFSLDCIFAGATGGTLDLYLQKLVDSSGNGIWTDWARFTQLAAAAAAINYTIGFDSGAAAPAITKVGSFTTAGAGTVQLTAGSVLAAHPGDQLRLLAVAGASTSAGAAQSIYLTGYERFT